MSPVRCAARINPATYGGSCRACARQSSSDRPRSSSAAKCRNPAATRGDSGSCAAARNPAGSGAPVITIAIVQLTSSSAAEAEKGDTGSSANCGSDIWPLIGFPDSPHERDPRTERQQGVQTYQAAADTDRREQRDIDHQPLAAACHFVAIDLSGAVERAN